MTSLEYAFEPSSCAAAPLGPNTLTPASARRSASPATSGASGPTTTKLQPCAASTSPWMSVTGTSTSCASRPIPGLPGAHSSSGCCGGRPSARTIACSRPPDPTTRTRGKLERGDEVVDRDRRKRLVAPGAARAELQRDAGDRRLVGGLDHVHEVEAAQHRPLRLDGGTQLLDLLVDLPDALRVVLDRLHALGGEGREHDVGGHANVSTIRRVTRGVRSSRGTADNYGRRRMNARIFALTAAIAAAAALPAAASAAQVQADRDCYEDNTGQVAVSGNGFDPGQPYQVTRVGKTLSLVNEVPEADRSVASRIET